MGIFLAPPCGTCSIARNIQLRDSKGKPMSGPRPLRSQDCPEGLPNLTATERLRVSSANKLYELVAKIVSFANDRKLLVVVENPRSSLFWRTKYWQSVAKTMGYTAHQACAFGGSRPKWTVLAWNHPVFAKLCMTCPGESEEHVHQPWGLVQTSEDLHFSTSEETAYPKPLALGIARCFAAVCIQQGWSPPLEQLEQDLEPSSKFMRAVATAQPKAAQMPPIVREHKQVIIIRGPHDLLQKAPVQAMQRLKVAWPVPKGCSAPISSLPAGAQLLRVTPLRSSGGILQEASCLDSKNQAEQAWGIPFSPDEFIYEAVQRGHPKAFNKLVPKFLKDAIINNFGSKLSLGELASSRAQWFARWTRRAKELSREEASFKADLPEHVRRILCPKRLLLWKEILRELGYGDMEVFDEISSGTHLVGEVPARGVFEKKFKSADLTVDQLASLGQSDRRKNFHRCASSGDPEIDKTVYEKTLEEVSMGWAKGPIKYDELPAGAVLSRRFGLRQPGKVRLIDDLTGSKVNNTVQTSESPKPQSVDYIGAMLLQILQMEGGLELRGRTYDLKSAYKQLAVAQCSLDFAYVVVFNPHSRQPEVFQLLAAPFGATRSVHSFLRIIHSVWYIGVAALKLVWSHFFDDFVVFCQAGHEGNTGNTVEMLLSFWVGSLQKTARRLWSFPMYSQLWVFNCS